MARSAARWRSRPTTSKSTTAATSTSSIARTPACISCSSPGLPARSRNSEETMAKKSVLARLDRVVDDFSRRTRYFHEEMTKGRARMFAMQHRLNTRHRNSVLKLKVATNCPDWDTRIGIIRACSEEVIADHEHGGGRAHWEILEGLGTRIGLKPSEIRAAAPIPTTQLAWVAWEGLMANRHWLEGIVANTCAERANVPGYGTGIMKKHGRVRLERHRWGRLFRPSDDDPAFFGLPHNADVDPLSAWWRAVERFARQLHMEDAVVDACEKNLQVWELYLNGIGEAGGSGEHTSEIQSH